MNEIVPQSSTCTYKGRIRGSYVKPKVMWVNPQGEDLSSLAQTSIIHEMDNIFAIESSIEIPCGQPPPSFVTTERERSPQIVQQSGMQQLRSISCTLAFSEPAKLPSFCLVASSASTNKKAGPNAVNYFTQLPTALNSWIHLGVSRKFATGPCRARRQGHKV